MFAYLLSIIFVYLLYQYWKFGKIVASVAHIPGPKALPFVGNALMFLGCSPVEMHILGTKMVEKYGLFQKFLLGSKVLICISDPKDVETLLVDKKIIDKSEEYELTQVWIGNGLLTASADKWHSRRKVTTPGFHFRCLQEYVKVFDKNSAILVTKIKSFEGATFDVFPVVQLCALDNICGEIR